MALFSKQASSENCNVKEELVSDANDQFTPTEAASPLTQGSQHEENSNRQIYKEQLYAGHLIKEELVIGPEGLQKSDSNVISEGINTGSLSREILHADVQGSVKNEKSIEIHEKMEDSSTLGYKVECNTVFEVAIIEASNKEMCDVKVSETRNFEVMDHSAVSLNLLKDNTVNSELKVATHLVCSKCEYQTLSSKFFEKHLRLHDTSRPFVCDSCGFRFNSKRCVLKHINRTYCKYKCSGNSSLKRRIKTYTGEKPFSCTFCNYSCNRSSALKEHLRIHTGEMPYICTYCKYSCNRSSDLKVHLRIHTGEKPYTCTYCNYSCGKSSRLKQHLRIHTGDKPYTCTYCNYSCSNRFYLNQHLKTHTGEKPYTCTYCKYSCIDSGTLKQHLRKHTGEKPYTCTYCNYSSSTSNLKRHLRTHTGEKPYACTYCKYSCIASSTLKRHLRTHTGEKPYTCTYCNCSFSRKSDMTRHLRCHTCNEASHQKLMSA